MSEYKVAEYDTEPDGDRPSLSTHLQELQQIVDTQVFEGGKPIEAMTQAELSAFIARVERYVQFQANYEAVIAEGSPVVVRGQGVVFDMDKGESAVPVVFCSHFHTVGDYEGVRLSLVPSRNNVAQCFSGQQRGLSNESTVAVVLKLSNATSTHPKISKHAAPEEPLLFSRLDVPVIYDMDTQATTSK